MSYAGNARSVIVASVIEQETPAELNVPIINEYAKLCRKPMVRLYRFFLMACARQKISPGVLFAINENFSRLKPAAPADRIRPVDFTTLRAIWNAWSKVWGIVGPLGNGAQWLYNVNARFHLGIRRAWYWLTNATAHWDASFEFEPADGHADLARILAQISDDLSRQPGFQVLRDTPQSKVIRANGIVFELNCQIEVLHIQVSDQTVSFRESQRIINSELMPIVERVEQAIPGARRKYGLTARFGADENPFLAVYLRRTEKQLITSFQCSYRLSMGQDDVLVSVNLDSVNLVAESRERFREASVKLLALSRP